MQSSSNHPRIGSVGDRSGMRGERVIPRMSPELQKAYAEYVADAWGAEGDDRELFDRCVLEAIYALDVIDLVAEPDQVAIIASNLVIALGRSTGYERRGRLTVTVKNIVQRNGWLASQVGTKAAEGYGQGPKVPLHFYPWDEAKYGPFESSEFDKLIPRETLARTDFERVADSKPINRAAGRVGANSDAFACLCGKLFGTRSAFDVHSQSCRGAV